MLPRFIRDRRRRRILKDRLIAPVEWRQLLQGLPVFKDLNLDTQERLRQSASIFLAEKRIYGAAGLNVDRGMGLIIAALACRPILNLDFDWLDGWRTVIVYPGEFRVRHRETDEHGLVSEDPAELSGESWERGPLVLSWADVEYGIQHPHDGENVVYHEIAHKLDMRNGEANGCPPLHPGMDRQAWTKTMQRAFDDLNAQVNAGQEPAIDPYAATDPAEFFAVVSEYYFEAPEILQATMPEVYRQLAGFYLGRM